MSRVFVPQEAVRRSRTNDRLEPLFSLEPAREFGEIEICLQANATHGNYDLDAVIDCLKDRLSTYTSDDYILLGGNLGVLALAVMLASEFNGGHVRLLSWEKVPGRYRVLDVSLAEALPHLFQDQIYDH